MASRWPEPCWRAPSTGSAAPSSCWPRWPTSPFSPRSATTDAAGAKPPTRFLRHSPTPSRYRRRRRTTWASSAWRCGIFRSRTVRRWRRTCATSETPFGTRVLVADLMGKDDRTRSAGTELLELWRGLATTEPSLAEIARLLDGALAERTDRFAKTLLLNLEDGRGELVCCGHPLPLVLSDHEDVRALDILAPLPPLGLFGLVPGGITVYTTSFSVGPTERLLIRTDGIDTVRDAAGTPFPLLERVRSHAGRSATALLDALVADVARHAGPEGDVRDESLLLLLQTEKREFQHLTTTLHLPRQGAPARSDGDRVGA
ncbi:PP2C family protein-serine/threonine phosphatase [Streptomyces sp. NPDC006422]|uniref:PP2C family protein-serine/threonine phosphatase n=1 Tax=unclassified Streptomyces TaxID=2593676 RepID=UPI0033ACE64E